MLSDRYYNSAYSSFTDVGYNFDVNTNDILDKEYIIIIQNDSLPQNDLYGNHRVNNISIYDVSRDDINYYQTAILFEFNLDNGSKFVLGHYNEHNGYYPVDIICKIYENGDATPMKFFSTIA